MTENEKPIEYVAWPAHQARCERCRASNDGTNLCEDGKAIFTLESDLVVTHVLLAGEKAESRAVEVGAIIEYMAAHQRKDGGN